MLNQAPSQSLLQVEVKLRLADATAHGKVAAALQVRQLRLLLLLCGGIVCFLKLTLLGP